MMKGLVWRIGLTICILALATAFLIPAYMNFNAPTHPETGLKVPQGPDFLPDAHINLGLDLRGGIQLTLGVEVDKALAASLYQTGQQTMREANSKGLLMTRPRSVGNDKLEFYLASQGKKGEMDALITELDQVEVVSSQEMPDGKIRYIVSLKPSAVSYLSDLTIEQALSTIRNRIDQFGVAEPDIRRQQDDNRISIQLPGLDDPQRAVEVIGKTAHLEFRMVRDDVDPYGSWVPSGVVILPMYEKNSKEGGESAGERKIAVESQPALTGEHITNAVPRYADGGASMVAISFDRQGSQIFGDLTRENVGRYLAIVLDGKVYSAPVIKEEIRSEASISGSFTPSEASDLALILRAGSLPAPVKVLEERTVGPSLGQQSIDMGVNAAVIGGLAVMIFMLVYYSFSGLIANLMLVLDIVLILFGMVVLGATMTLPGIAGIVLTLGMAVDANVLIFERIREELRKGMTPLAAIDAGFSRAAVAIFDSNLTTIIAAVILYQFGTGPIRGFAVTLTMGIIASMFTALFVSRIFFDIWVGKAGRKLRI